MTKRVEAAAKAAAKDDAEPNWYLETERFRGAWRNRMEAALVAADAVMFSDEAMFRIEKVISEYRDESPARIAEKVVAALKGAGGMNGDAR